MAATGTDIFIPLEMAFIEDIVKVFFTMSEYETQHMNRRQYVCQEFIRVWLCEI